MATPPEERLERRTKQRQDPKAQSSVHPPISSPQTLPFLLLKSQLLRPLLLLRLLKRSHSYIGWEKAKSLMLRLLLLPFLSWKKIPLPQFPIFLHPLPILQWTEMLRAPFQSSMKLICEESSCPVSAIQR